MLLDLAALRTFVTAVELGGFGRAARRLNRTPGAVSQQLKTLEERAGQPLFRKASRRPELTDAGRALVGYAQRMLAIHDEAVIALKVHAASGEVSLGMVQDAADSWLAETLGAFARACPAVRVTLQVGRSDHLRAAVAGGRLDMAVVFGVEDEATMARLPVRWWSHATLELTPTEAVPLLLLDPPCIFREQAIGALERKGRAWRPALSSCSVSALWAAARAGLGVMARPVLHVPDMAVPAPVGWELPELRPVAINLCQRDRPPGGPEVLLADLVRSTVESFQPNMVNVQGSVFRA